MSIKSIYIFNVLVENIKMNIFKILNTKLKLNVKKYWKNKEGNI